MPYSTVAMPPDFIQAKALEILVRLANPKRIWLFGSRARQDHPMTSDYDFALEEPALAECERWKVHEALEALPTLHTFDVVWLDAASTALKQQIARGGICLYER